MRNGILLYWKIKCKKDSICDAQRDDINKSKQGYMQNSLAEICQFVFAFLIRQTLAIAQRKWERSSRKRERIPIEREEEMLRCRWNRDEE